MFHKITKQQDIRKNHYWTIMLEKSMGNDDRYMQLK